MPTKSEWLYALLEGSEPISGTPESSSEALGNPAAENSMNEVMNRMMYEGSKAPVPGSVDLSPMPPPVMLSEPNAYGIRGLDEKIGEWALWGKVILIKH